MITHKDTGLVRNVTTGGEGVFSAPSIPAGMYEVKAEVPGFRTIVRDATVAVGGVTTVDLHLQIGAQQDIVTVESVTPQIEYERHTIDGVVNRQQIQNLPLNGRSFLQLAMLEPGVTVSSNAQGQYNRAFDVSVLGSDSNLTRITVDGATVRDSVTGGTQQNFSQEIVQEFQVSSVNFDLSTGVGAGGAVNVVTRSGSNQFHGSAFFFFRDHNMSAYPTLQRNPWTRIHSSRAGNPAVGSAAPSRRTACSSSPASSTTIKKASSRHCRAIPCSRISPLWAAAPTWARR